MEGPILLLTAHLYSSVTHICFTVVSGLLVQSSFKEHGFSSIWIVPEEFYRFLTFPCIAPSS